MTQPPGGPDTEPVPLPEPDPPPPLPPPEPVPRPEPPHADPPTIAFAPADGGDEPTEPGFIDAPPAATEPPYPPIGAFPDEQPTQAGNDEQPTQAGNDEQPTQAGNDEQPTQAGEAVRADEPTQYRVAPDQTEVLTPVAEQPTAWQPPWHAQHEKPGEWEYPPPEHLADEHSPVFGPPGPAGPPTPPWQVAPAAAGDDRRRKTGLWVSVALTTTLLLCGGGAFSAYLLLKEADGSGAPDPASAVNEFMTAIYMRQDASAADDLVCRESRDKDKLAARVNQIKGYANLYEDPSFNWDEPAVSGRSEERATVSVQLTMSTEDEKTAQQKLTFTTVHKTGWLVCEIAG